MEASILTTPQNRRRPIKGATVVAPLSPSKINRSRWATENDEGELVKHCWAEDNFLDSSRHRRSEIIRKKG